jgi:hypothetical protein
MEMKHKKSGYGFKDPSLHCATTKAKATATFRHFFEFNKCPKGILKTVMNGQNGHYSVLKPLLGGWG